MRNLHEIFVEDGRATALCDKFPRWSNFHFFIGEVLESIIHQPSEVGSKLFREFLQQMDAPKNWFDGLDDDGPGEIVLTELYENGLNRLVEEVFHILFRDVELLARFNSIIAGHITDFGADLDGNDDRFTALGVLKRISIPKYVCDMIYFRDGGECRSCKVSIDRMLSPEARERYDHIIPLAHGGPNDITNMQLLCQTCNSTKSARLEKVSNSYARVYPLNR